MAGPDSDSKVTDVHTRNVITLLESALASRDPSRRAQFLAEAQRQLGWAQRRIIDECQHRRLSWRQIGAIVGIAHDALYRQYASGGPVVTVSPFYRRESRNMQTTAQLTVAFRTVDDGHLHVRADADVHGLESFTMPFNPSGPSPYAGRDLQYYYRPVPDLPVADLGRSAGYTLRPEGFGIAFCITEEVMDELFGPPFIGSPERECWEVGQTAPIKVAGRAIGNPLAAVIAYLEEHPGAVRHYDFIAGTSDEVTAELVKATRMPWMASRITAREEAWFIERARCAPWDLVAPHALLRDADAAQPDGLYDAASALWGHFWADRPAGVAVAKISKVLYLMRPALFPILDSRLRSFYGPAAKAAARDVASRRPELAACKRMTWEAVRRDLLSNEAALRELRGAMRDTGCGLAAEASAKLSDLRLLDMLAWAA